MKVRIEKNVLNNGLSQVLNVVGMRTSLPVLSNVRLCAKEGALELITTNLDMGIRCTVAADVKEVGSIALPARRLASIAKALPEGTIELECSDDQAKLSCGCSKFRIMGMNDAEFPPLPMFEQTEFSMHGVQVRQGLVMCGITDPETHSKIEQDIFALQREDS